MESRGKILIPHKKQPGDSTMSIQLKFSRCQYRRIKRFFLKTKHKIEALRCRILLLLSSGVSVEKITELTGCVRATVYRTLYRYEDLGEDSLIDRRTVTVPKKVTDKVKEKLLSYLDFRPHDFGWHRSSWTLELLSNQIEKDCRIKISPRHIRNVLKKMKCRRGKPRVALRIPVRGRRKVLKKLKKLIKKASPKSEVFFVDEVDIDLNPKIGFTYIKQGVQPLVLTPGKNIKRYVAAALNARTGSTIFTDGQRKNSLLFIDLLELLARKMRKSKKIHLILDNYIIHKSGLTKAAIKRLKDRVVLHFLPPYSPDENRIERLFKQLHDHVTRNHQYPDIDKLMKAVRKFLIEAQPFPGKKVSVIRKRAA